MSIWQHEFAEKADVPEEFRLTLNEGFTPLSMLETDDFKIAVKDENANPNGSFKDRSLAYQVSYHISQGVRNFVISSSGNAAISAAAFLNKVPDANLMIFVAENINPAKLKKLNALLNERITLRQSTNPKSDAVKAAVATGAHNLRGSQDPKAIIGFKTIAYEIAKDYPQVDAVFIACSSGTSTLGICEGFSEMGLSPKINIVQTSKINVIAHELDHNYFTSGSSLADAISDRVAHRKLQVLDAIKHSHGDGWVISDAELVETKQLIGDNYSYNSLLAFAGYLKAVKSGNEYKAPLILASGL